MVTGAFGLPRIQSAEVTGVGSDMATSLVVAGCFFDAATRPIIMRAMIIIKPAHVSMRFMFMEIV
jgi:hypothetical protein